MVPILQIVAISQKDSNQVTNHQTVLNPGHAVLGECGQNHGYGRSYAKKFYTFCNFLCLRVEIDSNHPPVVSDSSETIGEVLVVGMHG